MADTMPYDPRNTTFTGDSMLKLLLGAIDEALDGSLCEVWRLG